MESIDNKFKISYLTKFLTLNTNMQGKSTGSNMGLTVSNTDPNIKKSISRVNKVHNGTNNISNKNFIKHLL